MLQQKIDSERYRAECVKKLSNFCEKSPVLLSFVTSDDGVTLIHANSNKKYIFPWEYTKPVKSFIHDIKMVLVQNHYPRLLEIKKEQVPLTPEEQAKLFENGTSQEDIPTTKEVTISKLWRIDRVIVWRDIFILVDEETGEQSRWKLQKSCVFFLKRYRSGGFTLESSADYFFKNATFLNVITSKETAEE